MQEEILLRIGYSPLAGIVVPAIRARFSTAAKISIALHFTGSVGNAPYNVGDETANPRLL